MLTSNRLAQAAERRIEAARGEITQSLKMEQQGRPLAAEPNDDRLTRRLMTTRQVNEKEARAAANRIKSGGPEVVQGDTVDFVGVFYFEQGRRAARSVARVRTPEGFGTGFMVSKDLFVTNNHVISSREMAAGSQIEFDFEDQESGGAQTPTVFALDPKRFFVTDDVTRLDFTLVAIGDKVAGSGTRDDYGYCKLSAAENKHSLGELANIIQHPEAHRKQVVLRENRLAARTREMLLYVADTQPGSSGSPVFNNEWQVIALHHYGAPSRPDMVDEAGIKVPNNVNEGIRASAIVAFLEEHAATLSPAERQLLAEGKTQPDWLGPAARTSVGPKESLAGVRIDGTGSATWRIPIEITIRIPGADPGAIVTVAGASSAASKPD